MTNIHPRVRIAPSPTGDPHVGTAYIALFNYVFSKKHSGEFILRIEDTDQQRSRAGSEQAILDALHWLGIDWDEGPDKGGPFAPYRQSERQEIYNKHAEILIQSDHAYRCFCTSDRLAALRLSQRQENVPSGYDRFCRSLSKEESEKRYLANEAHTIRLAMPRDGMTTLNDHLRGKVEFENRQIDDQILLKSDGMPTYHLANVVDDHLMKITHVIRAEEWISSTPKHIALYDAFGWEHPVWIHMPLLRNNDHSKISKRKNPVSINYYRDAGILPHALRNFLGIMGWSFGNDREVFSLEEMIEAFSWERISLGGPVFGLDKLHWMNEQYLKQMSDQAIVDALMAWRLNNDQLLRIIPLIRDRIKRFDDFFSATDFFFCGDINYSSIAAQLSIPDLTPSKLAKKLSELVETYEALPVFTTEILEKTSRDFATNNDWKTKHLFMTLRHILTGRKASPPLFETMEVLGKELVFRRIRKAIEFLRTIKQ